MLFSVQCHLVSFVASCWDSTSPILFSDETSNSFFPSSHQHVQWQGAPVPELWHETRNTRCNYWWWQPRHAVDNTPEAVQRSAAGTEQPGGFQGTGCQCWFWLQEKLICFVCLITAERLRMEIGYKKCIVHVCPHRTCHTNPAASFQPLGFAEALSNTFVPKAGCKCTGLAWVMFNEWKTAATGSRCLMGKGPSESSWGFLAGLKSWIVRSKSSFIWSLILPLFQLLSYVCCISETEGTKCSPGCPGEHFGGSVRADASPGGCPGSVCREKWVPALLQGMQRWERCTPGVSARASPDPGGFILNSLQTFT